jgi:hypothetical protein
MKKKHHSSRGSTTVLALIFMALFGALSISFAALSNTNLLMARNHRDLAAARTAAESGLEYMHNLINYYVSEYGLKTFNREVTADDAYVVFHDLYDFLQVELKDAPMLNKGSIHGPLRFSDHGQSGEEVIIKNIRYSSDERAKFSLQIRQYDDDPMTLEVLSIGKMEDIRRRVRIEYSLEKDQRLLQVGVASKSPINISGNSTIGSGIYTGWQNPEIAPPTTLEALSTIDGDINTVLSPEDFDGLGYTLEDALQGQYDQLNYDRPEVDMPSAEDFDTSMYVKEVSGLTSGQTYNQKEYYPHAPASYTTPIAESIELNRTVYENMIIDGKRAISGNALFKNCTFEGIFYVGTTSGLGTNNVRFENCIFNGPIITGVPPRFGPEDWKKNALYFTGDCVFNNTVMAETTILAPNYNVDIGSGTGNSTLTGLVLGGVVDVRGSATIDGTIVSMADPMELGDYATKLETTIGVSDQGTNTITINPNTENMLPIGISTKILINRNGNSFVELEN